MQRGQCCGKVAFRPCISHSSCYLETATSTHNIHQTQFTTPSPIPTCASANTPQQTHIPKEKERREHARAKTDTMQHRGQVTITNKLHNSCTTRHALVVQKQAVQKEAALHLLAAGTWNIPPREHLCFTCPRNRAEPPTCSPGLFLCASTARAGKRPQTQHSLTANATTPHLTSLAQKIFYGTNQASSYQLHRRHSALPQGGVEYSLISKVRWQRRHALTHCVAQNRAWHATLQPEDSITSTRHKAATWSPSNTLPI